ncbi:ecdysteroid kinase domain-containing protein [Ditylenchus destructor]|uniref:Ecdysteroid kinase domain-containing protein n=1 Tax=Ditylenchus destructor TaxID=166010 RepID=A0AAD4MMQ4_9BILA|nr:ecdysteroid kinase domain-containing protein [Ditylenchus destructor]
MANTDTAKLFSNEDFAGEMLSDSVVSNGFIVEKLLDGSDQFREIMKCSKIKTICGKDICESNGFTSKIYLVSIEFQQENGNSSEQQKFSAVMKTVCPKRVQDSIMSTITDVNKNQKDDIGKEEFMEKIAKNISLIHNQECDFYTLFGNISKEIMPLPDIYYIQKSDLEKDTPGVIIMEDLTESSCMVPIYEGLSVQQIKTIVRHLAAFHHFLLCETDANWKKICGKFVFEDCENDFGDRIVENVVEWNKDYFEVPLRKLKNVVKSKQMIYALRECAQEFGLPELLVHGDLWTNNLLWKKTADGSNPERVAAFMDWQLLFKGNLAVDIANIISCCEPDVRKELESFILEYYYDEFSRRMHDSGKSVGYRIEQLRKAYEYAFISKTVSMCGMAHMCAQIKKEDGEDKNKTLAKRAKIAVEDAVVLVERIAPEWLCL